jgi:hypothetical protein
LEDRAYSLLGIFGVNMPLLYGEGEKAFIRLQEEIMKSSDDQSLFAWGYGKPRNDMRGREGGLFATSPDDFSNADNIVAGKTEHHYAMTNKGLLVNLKLMDHLQPEWSFYAVLTCYYEAYGDINLANDSPVGLPLVYDGTTFYRDTSRSVKTIGHPDEHHLLTNGEPRYISRDPPRRKVEMLRPDLSLSQHGLDVRANITECYPERWTSALRGDGLVPWIEVGLLAPDMNGADVILFRYWGGEIPSFIAKLHCRFTVTLSPVHVGYMSLQHLECLVAWFPAIAGIPTLESLIAHHLDHSQSRDPQRSSAPSPRWCDALDAVLDWQPDLSLRDGTTLSVQALPERYEYSGPHWKLCFQVRKPDSVPLAESSMKG